MPTPCVAQAAQRAEQADDLVGGQARGRFIEHEDLGVGRERSGDRDQRFLRPGKALDPQVGIDVGAEFGQRAFCAPSRPGPFNQAETMRIAERQGNVLGHRHPVDETEILVDEGHGHAPDRVGRVVALVGDRSAVGCMDAGKNLDQRRLPRAVFAEQRHDLPVADGHADVAERLRAAEAL